MAGLFYALQTFIGVDQDDGAVGFDRAIAGSKPLPLQFVRPGQADGLQTCDLHISRKNLFALSRSKPARLSRVSQEAVKP